MALQDINAIFEEKYYSYGYECIYRNQSSDYDGEAVIKGTRITVEMVLESLSAGESVENLLDAYPRLSKEAILAALSFAAEALKGEKIYPVAV